VKLRQRDLVGRPLPKLTQYVHMPTLIGRGNKMVATYRLYGSFSFLLHLVDVYKILQVVWESLPAEVEVEERLVR
jgi:hypothetical protein